jgi:hypothetical protein
MALVAPPTIAIKRQSSFMSVFLTKMAFNLFTNICIYNDVQHTCV